jgi:integrase
MTPSTGKRPYHIKNTRPTDPNVVPISQWSNANRGCYQAFQDWLSATGYCASTIRIYAVGARFILGYLKKPYWLIDQDKDIDLVWAYFYKHHKSMAKRSYYRKGFRKFKQYLLQRRKLQNAPKEINWPYYLEELPSNIASIVREYIRHSRRNWRAEQRYESTISLLSRLTFSLRWVASQISFNSLVDLTPQAWYAYLDMRLEQGISPVTLNSELRTLWSFLRFAQGLSMPVCERFFKIKKLQTGLRIPKDIPAEQVRTLLAEVRQETSSAHIGRRRMGVMDMAWFLLMLHSGLRTGEIRRLRLGDVDIKNKKLRIEQSKGLKDRHVFFSNAVASALRAYLTVRGPEDTLPDQVFIFRHQALSKSYCRQRLRTYGKRCRVEITPHQLRHTCATLLLNERVPVVSLQMILGHQHISTTMHYARLYDGTVAADYYQAIGRIEEKTSGPNHHQPSRTSPKEILDLLSNLHNSPLNHEQRKVVISIQKGIDALVNQELYAP